MDIPVHNAVGVRIERLNHLVLGKQVVDVAEDHVALVNETIGLTGDVLVCERQLSILAIEIFPNMVRRFSTKVKIGNLWRRRTLMPMTVGILLISPVVVVVAVDAADFAINASLCVPFMFPSN